MSTPLSWLIDSCADCKALSGRCWRHKHPAVVRAREIIESSLQTHRNWLTYIERGGAERLDIAGDAAHHREAIEGYEFVLDVLGRDDGTLERPYVRGYNEGFNDAYAECELTPDQLAVALKAVMARDTEDAIYAVGKNKWHDFAELVWRALGDSRG